MSYQLMDTAWNASGLTMTEQCVLVALSRYADTTTGYCWPSVATLAAVTGGDKSTIRRILRRLETSGHITVVPRTRPDGTTASNGYVVHEIDDTGTITRRPVPTHPTGSRPRASRPVDNRPSGAGTRPGPGAQCPPQGRATPPHEPVREPVKNPLPADRDPQAPTATGGGGEDQDLRSAGRRLAAAILDAHSDTWTTRPVGVVVQVTVDALLSGLTEDQVRECWTEAIAPTAAAFAFHRRRLETEWAQQLEREARRAAQLEREAARQKAWEDRPKLSAEEIREILERERPKRKDADASV